MGSSGDIRKGSILKVDGENYIVIDYMHVTPGKGPAHHQVKMRHLKTGRLSEKRFRTGESVDFIRLERRQFQYLYPDGDVLYFMSMDNFEQIPVQIEAIGDEVHFLKENEEVQIAFEGDTILSVEVPLHVNLRVEQTEPGFRGDTATNVLKPAVLETGATVQVPLFIDAGDLVRVDTRSGAYIERVKE